MIHLISHAINIEQETSDNWRLIHFICKYRKLPIIKHIVEKGVNLECETKNGWRPIHFVCKTGDFEAIKYLLNCGVNIESETYTYLRPLHILLQYSDEDTVMYFLNKGIEMNKYVELNRITKDNTYPFMLACIRNFLQVIIFMLDNNVEMCFGTEENQQMYNPIDCIFELCKPHIVNIIFAIILK